MTLLDSRRHYLGIDCNNFHLSLLIPKCCCYKSRAYERGGQGRTMTQGPMEFRGPMSSRGGPSKWHWEVKGPSKSHITVLFLLEITWFRAEKPLKFRRRTFFLVITSFFGPNSSIFSVYLDFTKSQFRHIWAGPGPTFGSRRPCTKHIVFS